MKSFQVPDDYLLGKRIAEDVSIKLNGADIRVDMVSSEQIIDSETGELICEANQKITKEIKEKLANLKKIAVNLLACNQEIDLDTIALIHELNIASFTILHTNDLDRGSFICNTLDVDPTHDQLSLIHI